jgi:hypothetical protein
MRSPIEQYAYLFVESDEESTVWDPDDLTAALGVEPTAVRLRGELNRQGRPIRRTSWTYAGDSTADDDTDAVVRAVAEAVEPRAEAFREYVATKQLSAGINVILKMISERTFVGEDDDEDAWGVPTPAVGVKAGTVQLLARLGIGVDFDMYIDLPEDVLGDAESNATT